VAASPRASLIAGIGIAAAAVAAIALPLPAFKVPGPWWLVGWMAAIAALAAGILVLVSLNRQARDLEASESRAALAEAERDTLQRDSQRHGQLERELLQAKQEAEAAVLAKGEFLATMSHEIRTPLNGIIPMLEMIGAGPLAPDQREMLQTASLSSQQLLRIVDDILDYSRLEANRLELETTSFNLRELLDSVIQLMAQPAQRKHLKLELHIDPAVRLPVRGDPLRLRQVIGNLVGNAIKFTEQGGVVVNVSRQGETASRHKLRFEVIDTGIGLSAEQQSRLFNSFTQADASTTRLYGGTGLGLAISKRIVELMEGRIGVESEPGRGSRFWFEIPLLKIVGDLRPGSDDARPRVLLVSPDDTLRQRVTTQITNLDLAVTAVDTTQEALDKLRASESPDHPAYVGVVADMDNLRLSARALHRSVMRMPADAMPRLIWMHGESEIADELRDHGGFIPRPPPDAALRMALVASIPTQRTASSVPPVRDIMRPEHPASIAATPAMPTVPLLQIAGSRRLLLVEDNPVNRLVAQKMLASLGHECDTAENGHIALERLSRAPYGLVLMDCQMPVIDGYEATRSWREQETARGAARLPIIAMTANAMTGDRQRCLDAGMDDYLAKPVGREQLDACLKHWLPAMTDIASGMPAAQAAPSLDARAMQLAAPTIDNAKPIAHAPLRQAGPPPAATSLPPSTPPGSDAPAPVLDESILDELAEFAGAEMHRIVRLFLEDAPSLLRMLEQAATEPDLAQMQEAAHTLKSSSANVGALALSATAKRIEMSARVHKLERPAVAVALLIAEHARARVALLGYLSRHPEPGSADTAPGTQSSSLVSR